ncbi:MAG: hypothetical protein ABIQ44_14340 [Chloroflexia bacterium]
MSRPENEAGQSDNTLDLPWLRAVNDKAVLPTTGLTPANVAPTPSTPVTAPEPPVTDTAPEPDTHQAEPPVEPAVEMQAAPEPEPEATEPPDAPPPNWVVGILEPLSGPAVPEGTYEPEELSHIMPWAHKSAGAAEEEQTDAEEAIDDAPPGLPPWLDNVTVQETLQSVPSQELRSTELTDLGIEGVEPFDMPVEEEDRVQSVLPDFVRNIGGEGSQQTVEDAPTQPAPMPTYERTVTAPPSAFELDDDMVAVVVRDTPVRAPRPGSVETLAALLQPVAHDSTQRVVPMPVSRSHGAIEDETTTASKTGRSKIAQWLFPTGVINILILVTLLSVLIIRPPFGDTPAPPSPGVTAFYNAIEAVPLDRPVLVVYDWDAGRSAEMSVMSRAIMYHIARRHLSFVTVSTVPQGPGFAQEYTDMLRTDPSFGYEYGTDYLVLGYLPGSEAALRTLVGSFSAVLPLDYVNSRSVGSYQLTAGGALNKIEDFALIVDLAGSEAEMRNWIEQVASRTNVPIVAAVPQGLDPLARPYLNIPNAGLQAIVSGTTGAFAYARQLETNGQGSAFTDAVNLTSRMNAQSVASLLVALVIAAALLVYGARRILRKG